jgi:single-stranded DNA-binding protein
MNIVEIEGFTSFSKVHNFQGGAFSHRFSITLQAGKDKTGQYRREYIDVRLSSECSGQIQYPGDGSRIKVKGRLRCEPWVDRNQQKRKAIYVEAFEAQVIQAPNTQFQGQVPQQQRPPQPPPPQHNNPNQYRAQPAYQQPAPPQGFKPPMPSQPPQQAPQAPQAPQGQPAPAAPPNVGQWDEGIPF